MFEGMAGQFGGQSMPLADAEAREFDGAGVSPEGAAVDFTDTPDLFALCETPADTDCG